MTTKKKQIEHEIIKWTPAMAENMLTKNEVNRTIRPSVVDKYSRDMASGKWNFSMIAIDEDGKLIDGQHRLMAIAKSGISVELLTVKNVPNYMQKTFDVGAGRSVADIFTFSGESQGQLLAAITRLVFQITDNKLTRGRYTSTVEEVLQTLDDHSELRVSTDIATWFNSKRMIPLQPSIVGAAHWMIMDTNGREEADAFVHRLGTLVGEEDGSPVLALSKRVNEIKRMGVRVNSRDVLNLIIKTWNYCVEGRTITKINLYSRTGEFKLLEPLVVEKTETDEED